MAALATYGARSAAPEEVIYLHQAMAVAGSCMCL